MKRKLGSAITVSRVIDFFILVFLFFVCAIMIYPLLRIVALSLSEAKFITTGQVGVIPRGFNIEGYKIILSDKNVWIAYKNTILYTVAGTILSLAVTSLVAYPLSMPGFVFKKSLTIFLAITMFFNGGLIPTYITILKLGGINSFWVMVVPGCLSAYNAFVYRSFFQGIPTSLRESAYLDGANDLTIFLKIILPLSKALLATFGLFAAVGYWNSWFKAMLYLRDTSLHPVQMFLRKLLVIESMDMLSSSEGDLIERFAAGTVTARNIQMAAVVVVMVPILCVYPFVQRYFVKGVMIGSIKG